MTTSRISSRARNKSQRALESEDTNRLLAKAKALAQASAESPTGSGEASTSKTQNGRLKDKHTRKGKAKKKQDEVWCICKTSGGNEPMIECGVCNDWYVSLDSLELLASESRHRAYSAMSVVPQITSSDASTDPL